MSSVLEARGECNAGTAVDAPLRIEEDSSADPRLLERRRAWDARPLTRALYRGYYQTIKELRSHAPGIDLEIGAGHGGYAEYVPGTVATDLGRCSWLDCVADAMHLPFRDGALANLILIDVLHHLDDPSAFLTEAQRALCEGGRILLVEPYVSPVSWIAWRFFHTEHIDGRVNPFTDSGSADHDWQGNPWDANIAFPTLMFFRHLRSLREQFPRLRLVHRRRFDMLVMPLSGGFSKPRLIPHWMVPILSLIERTAKPLAPLLSFRCLVVLEKSGGTSEV